MHTTHVIAGWSSQNNIHCT